MTPLNKDTGARSHRFRDGSILHFSACSRLYDWQIKFYDRFPVAREITRSAAIDHAVDLLELEERSKPRLVNESGSRGK